MYNSDPTNNFNSTPLAASTYTYCDCNDNMVAGVNTLTESGSSYLVCAASPTPITVSTIVPSTSEPATSSSEPAPTSTDSPPTSTTDVASTSTDSPPTSTTDVASESTSPAPTPTAQIKIMFDWMEYLGETGDQWYVYNNAPGTSSNVCGDSVDVLKADKKIDPSKNVPYPDGTFNIRGRISGMKDCVYTGTADSPGTFSCPALNGGASVSCLSDPESDSNKNLVCGALDGSTDTIYPKVLCQW
ncbi:hypothetical protein LTR66_009069 [Elasticomyces elasticus]|nr:hypothetical protein LTR66_009069 [Elasticomyces elasticus]